MRTRLTPVIALLLVLGGCGESADPVVLTQADSGTEVLLKSGQRFEVQLDSNPSTGFQWRVDEEPIQDLVETISTSYETPTTDAVGAAGREITIFEAKKAGAGVLRLEYIREFENPPVPERIVEFILRVDGASWTRTSDSLRPPTSRVLPPAGPDEVIELGELLSEPDPRYVVVTGFVIWDGSSARLCEVLMESYPPQCGGQSVTIVDPLQLDPEIEFAEAQQIRWTDTAIEVAGYFDGEQSMLLGQSQDAEED